MNLKTILLVVMTLSVAAVGQSFRGGILGTVRDATGASVADAKVTATDTGTGLSRESTTDADGNYSFTELPLGTYTVTATKQGFRTQLATNIQVAVEGPQRANLTLTPGRVDEKVEVQADVPLVETSSNTLGGTLQAADFQDLPVNGRDFMKMLTAVPGANADPSSVNDSPGSFGVFSVNGNRGRSNNFLLDGTDMNDGFRNDNAINEGGVFGIPATLLPVDAIQEMAILNNTEAEFGRNSGSIVNIVTKSGSNDLHGSVFEYFRNNALDARNYFNCAEMLCASDVAGGPQNAFHNNQFGGSLGGPIIKDKTFFLVSYEGQRERVGFPSPATIPSQALIALDTPVGGINPIIQNILNTNPWGTLPAVGNDAQGLTYTEEVNAPSSNRLDSVIAKIDQHIGQNDLLTGRYYFGDSSQSAPLAIVGGNVLPGFNTVVPTRVQVVSLSFTHVISPKLLAEFRGGWNRFAETFSAQDVKTDPASLGLNTSNDDFTNLDFGLPVISVGGFAGLGANKSNPRGRVDSNLQYLNNFAYISGNHNWKFGYEFRRTSVNQYFDLNHRGKLSFDSLSDFLDGDVSGGGSQTQGNSRRNTYQNNQAFYLQDNFRISHRVTLNYGLRWDYYGVIGEKDNLFSILNSSDNLVQVGANGGPSSLYPKDYNNFSPRIGVAYDVFGTGKTVFRAGYGFAYDAFSQDFFAGQIPYVTSNAGPLFNDVGPRPISYGSAASNVLQPVTCGTAGSIPVPGSNLCTGPIFGGFGSTDVFTVDQRLRTPYVQNYNLNIEQALASKTSISVAYVGSAGRKLFRFIDLNQGDPATGVRPISGYNYVLNFQSSAISNYNSLQVRLNVRDLHGFTSTVNYTYSHSIDTASDGQDYAPFQAQPDNSFNVRDDRSNSGFDVRQRFSWLWNYRIPESHSMHLLTGGWSVSGVVSLATGMPFTVIDYDDFNNTGELYERPDLVGNPWAGTSSPANFLNLSAFAASCANPDVTNLDCPTGNGAHFGSSPRNGFYGPHYRNFDFSIKKDTNFGERVNMQLSADFFNLFNHPNFANPLLPSFNVLWDGGIDPTGRGTGFFPLTVTPDVGAQNPFLGGGGPRDIQLAVRFSF
jgi:Carboxypeptidase regulatory-like domain/TonB-dependent Receptor Plug Domain/TonB dependent receptor